MAELTKQQETILIRIYRSRWARILVKERKIFRQNVNELHNWYRHGSASFISKDKVSCELLYGTLELPALNTVMQNLNQNLLRTDTAPEIELDFDSDNNSYDAIEYDSIKPFAHIFHYRYSFLNLNLCQRRINSSLANMLRDARFKFAHQYNGKDVRNYLAIIEREEEKMRS